ITHFYTDSSPWRITTNLDFIPSLVYISCNVTQYNSCYIRFSTNVATVYGIPIESNQVYLSSYINNISSTGFVVNFNGIHKLDTRPDYNDITWYAFE
ncbi:TPA: hypothetical protein ACKOR7_004205, partial [Clostridioides difficile]